MDNFILLFIIELHPWRRTAIVEFLDFSAEYFGIFKAIPVQHDAHKWLFDTGCKKNGPIIKLLQNSNQTSTVKHQPARFATHTDLALSQGYSHRLLSRYFCLPIVQ